MRLAHGSAYLLRNRLANRGMALAPARRRPRAPARARPGGL